MNKRKMRLVQFLLVCFLVVFGQVMCTQAASAKLNKKKATIYIGKTVTLKVTGAKSKVKWSSSNKKVATVNSKGKVTGKKAGKATITAKVKNKKYTCKVTVKNVLAVSKTKLTVKEKSSIKVTFKKNGTVYFKSADPDIVTCKWSKKWKNNKTTLYMYAGEKPGTTTVTISNSWSKEKIKITATVKGPWDSVKVVIPDTIGEQDNTDNRMKITDYSFYKPYTWTDDYEMNVEFKLVQYGTTGRSNWGEYVFIYDKYGNLLDKEYLYASSLALGKTYNYTLDIPADAAKIEFKEYPDMTAPGTNDGTNDSTGDNTTIGATKWSYSDATNLNGYANDATDYANKAFDYYNETINASSAYKVIYAKRALNNISYAKRELNDALELAKARAELTTTDGETLVSKIETALASWDKVTYTSVDSSNVDAVCAQLKECVSTGNLNCIAVQALSVSLLKAFTN